MIKKLAPFYFPVIFPILPCYVRCYSLILYKIHFIPKKIKYSIKITYFFLILKYLLNLH